MCVSVWMTSRVCEVCLLLLSSPHTCCYISQAEADGYFWNKFLPLPPARAASLFSLHQVSISLSPTIYLSKSRLIYPWWGAQFILTPHRCPEGQRSIITLTGSHLCLALTCRLSSLPFTSSSLLLLSHWNVAREQCAIVNLGKKK